jgi:hypothetical protein
LRTGAYGVVYSAINHCTGIWYAVKALSKTNHIGEPLDHTYEEFQSREIHRLELDYPISRMSCSYVFVFLLHPCNMSSLMRSSWLLTHFRSAGGGFLPCLRYRAYVIQGLGCPYFLPNSDVYTLYPFRVKGALLLDLPYPPQIQLKTAILLYVERAQRRSAE